MRPITEDVGLIKEQQGPPTGRETQAAVMDSLTTTFETLGSTRTRFVFSIIRRLTDGEPVEAAPVATHHGLTPDSATRLLRRIGAEVSRAGEVTSLGISLTPTPHSYRTADRQLYTWCAPDAILFPIFFGQTATINSSDPVDNHRIRLIVSAERVEDCQPTSAVVSLVSPDKSEEVRAGSCAYGHFFSPATAKQWTSRQATEANILTVKELHEIGRRVLRIERLRDALTSS